MGSEKSLNMLMIKVDSTDKPFLIDLIDSSWCKNPLELMLTSGLSPNTIERTKTSTLLKRRTRFIK